MIVLDRKPWAYYNDFEPSSVAWLKELIKSGLIADGEVDGRSILEVQADDLSSFTQCHFFAGIGGWSYALRLAGWRDDCPVWTGSPPCQPFSSAGRQKGNQDERHLAPHFAELVSEGRPPILFGEQVASAAVFGKAASATKRGVESAPEWAWLDDLSDRFEAAHYAIGASDIPAAGIGAPHIRQRTFFGAVRLADADDEGLSGLMQPIDINVQRIGRKTTERCFDESKLATSFWRQTFQAERGADGVVRLYPDSARSIGNGVSAAMEQLRGYGNAIVPQAAATFIQAFCESLKEPSDTVGADIEASMFEDLLG